MIRSQVLSIAALFIVPFVSAADAKGTAHRVNAHKHFVRYSRPGPPSGYKFGWATYRGDPSASDDYFDGHRCYYLHHRDFCVSRHWRGGFRW